MLVSFDKLEPGMEVARDIINVNGAVLLAAGNLLTDRHLRTLRAWGVDVVHIKESNSGEEEPAGGAEVTPGIRSEAQEAVAVRFKHVTSQHWAVEAVKELAIRRAAARLAGSSKPSTPVLS